MWTGFGFTHKEREILLNKRSCQSYPFCSPLLQKKVDASFTTRSDTAFNQFHWRRKLMGHTLGFGEERCTQQCQQFLKTTWMEPQPSATLIQGIFGQRLALGRYKHAQLHDKGKQSPILTVWAGPETEPNKKGPSPVLVIRPQARAINLLRTENDEIWKGFTR